MALTKDDIEQIRDVVYSVIHTEVPPMIEKAIKPLQDEIQALRNDIKEIYDMITQLQKGAITDASFAKLTLKEKLLRINAELLAAANQAGITLPR